MIYDLNCYSALYAVIESNPESFVLFVALIYSKRVTQRGGFVVNFLCIDSVFMQMHFVYCMQNTRKQGLQMQTLGSSSIVKFYP